MKRFFQTALLTLGVYVFSGWMVCADMDLFFSRPAAGDDIMSLLESPNDFTWHHPGWRFRQRLTVTGPQLMQGTEVLILPSPDPLLLYNTVTCAPDLADLRITDAAGQVYPGGIHRFGTDDGSSFIWCRLPAKQRHVSLDLFLYYGKPDAEPLTVPAPARFPSVNGFYVQSDRPMQEPGSPVQEEMFPAQFFDEIIVVDAAALDDGIQSAPGASCGTAVLPGNGLQTEIELPADGSYRLLLRVGGSQDYASVRVAVDDNEAAPAQLVPGADAGWRWMEYGKLLTAGRHTIGISAAEGVLLDCLLFTRNHGYIPDSRDLSGPVWMRYRVDVPEELSTHASLYCVHTPYSSKGMLGDYAGWVFGDVSTSEGRQAAILAKDTEAQLPAGLWSPWIQALHSRRYTWFSRFSLHAEGGRAPVGNTAWTIQFATRPTSARVYHQSKVEGETTVNVRMPTSLALSDRNGLQQQTRTFADWARDRFALVESLGFKSGEGPRRLSVGFMAHTTNQREEFEYMIKTAAWLGCNTLNINYPDAAVYTEIMEKEEINGYFFHPWASALTPEQATEVKAFGENLPDLHDRLKIAAEQHFHNWSFNQAGHVRHNQWNLENLKFSILGDEISEVIAASGINDSPFLLACFHEYLADAGLEPSFFGAAAWNEVKAVLAGGSDALLDETLPALPERGVELAAETMMEAATAAALEEVRRTVEADHQMTEPASEYGKRLFFWTERFRSYYYCKYYGAWSRAKSLRFPAESRGAVNLQADLTQRGRMWQGQCNIWDQGRLNAFDALMTEDWFSRPFGVAFGYEMLRAAARKNGQPLASLVVGLNPGLRSVVHLAQESRYLYYYLYGPVHNIGPVWAEHEPTLRDIGRTTRMIARCEDEIIGARRAPATAAVLVSNASEINSAYRYFPLGKARQAVYLALLNAHVEAEVVGEDEILLDDALSRYRVLYVTDPWVQRRTFAAIRNWVEAGGILWAGYAAMTFDEYDEPLEESASFFGITARDDIRMLDGVNESWNRREAWPALAGVQHDLPLNRPGRQPLIYRSAWFKPEWEVTEATVEQSFADGTPAVISRIAGVGKVLLHGFNMVRDTVQVPEEQAEDAAALALQLQAELVAVAAQAGGLQPLVRSQHRPGLYVWRHLGPDYTLLYLANVTGSDLREQLSLNLPAEAVKVYSSLQDRWQPVTQTEGGIVFDLDLPVGSGDILLLR